MSVPSLDQRPDDWPSRIGGGIGVGFAAGEPASQLASEGSRPAGNQIRSERLHPHICSALHACVCRSGVFVMPNALHHQHPTHHHMPHTRRRAVWSGGIQPGGHPCRAVQRQAATNDFLPLCNCALLQARCLERLHPTGETSLLCCGTSPGPRWCARGGRWRSTAPLWRWWEAYSPQWM